MRLFFFFSSRRRHTRWPRDWSSDVCSSDLAERDLLLAPVLAEDAQPGQPVSAQVDDQVLGERLDAEQPGVLAVRDDWRPRGRLAHGGLRELEVLRMIVVQDQQAVGAVRADLMLDAVLHPGPARHHDAELAVRPRGVQQPRLAGQLARGRYEHVTLAAGEP